MSAMLELPFHVQNQLYANALDDSRRILEGLRPFMLLRPRMFPDGNQWCALYGDNLQEGVAGFGDTPEQASIQFDVQWRNEKAGKV